MLLASPAALHTIGKPADQVLGRTAAEWLDDPAQAEIIMIHDRSILETGRIQMFCKNATITAYLTEISSHQTYS